MKVVNLTAFRAANGITQRQIADYLGVTSPFVTRIEGGHCKMPNDKLEMLIDNDRGWDTSMLVEEIESSVPAMSATASGRGVASINIASGYKKQNADMSEALYKKDIERLTDQINMYKMQIEILKSQIADKDNTIELLKSLINK